MQTHGTSLVWKLDRRPAERPAVCAGIIGRIRIPAPQG